MRPTLTLREAPAGLALALLVLAACSRGGGGGGEAPRPAFVDSAACAACHPAEHGLWLGSHHDRAMQPATADTVLGDFDGATFEHRGRATSFFRRGERYFVNAEGADGERADFEVRYTFGVEPLQQYLLDPGRGDGRLQCLTVAWDVARGEWFSLYPDEDVPPGDPLHWTGRYQRWNLMCADCHSTHLVRGYDPATDGYDTTWHEIDVGCQACHGPGEAHVEWARKLGGRKPDDRHTYRDKGLVVDLRRDAPAQQLDACAPCHSRRHALLSEPAYGEPFLDGFVPERLVEGLYHADGQILDEVYVYGSFTQSLMHRRGVACTDCHDPHSARPWLQGDALCLQCHSVSAPVERFPTLKKKAYDVAEHHHHPADSEGARCTGCHMPERTYMVVDPRRDHSFRVPRPDLTVKIGTPDACSGCHADQGAEWAAERVAEWFPGTRRGPHYGEVLARGRAGDERAPAELASLAADPEQAGIVRATALDLLRDYGPRAALAAAGHLADADPLVRTAALRALDGAPAQARLAVLPLLADPIRAVRVEAARVAAVLPAEALTEEQRVARAAALEEFTATQLASADQPWAHLNLGVMHADRGERERARKAYERALELDPTFLPARFNLGTLLNRMGRNAEALEVLRAGLQAAPDEGELHYSIGLLLAEMGRLDDAAESLERAARKLGTARAHYNAGLAYSRLDRPQQAESLLLNAHRLDASDPDVVHALTLHYVEREDWPRARGFALQLVELTRGAAGTRELLARIEAELTGG